MYNLLVFGVTAAVIAILGLFHHEILSYTITSGEATFFTTPTWENVFTNKSLIEMSDASIAFFADRFVPAIIPGSTSTGRPYIVSLFENANVTNVTVPNATPLNISDPVVVMSLIKASMHVDREPFTWIQGLLSVAMATIFIFTTIMVVGLVLWYRYRSRSKMLQKVNTALNCTITTLHDFNLTLLNTNTTLHNTIAQFKNAMAFVERLCTSKTSESLIQLKAELPTTGQIPYLPHLRRDAALLKCEGLELSLAQKADDFDELDGKFKKANASHEHLQSALDRKTADYNNVCGQRDAANEQCRILGSRLENTEQKLQAAEAKLDAILKSAPPPQKAGTGPTAGTGIKDSGVGRDIEANKPPTSEPKKIENDGSSPSPNDRIPASKPISEGSHTNAAAEPLEEQDPVLPTSDGTNDSGHKFAPASKGRSNALPSPEPTPARGRSDSPAPRKSSPPRARGSPIRSTMPDLYEQVKRNRAADAAAALYGPAPQQSSDKDSVFVQPQLKDRRGGRGAGLSSSSQNYHGDGYRDGQKGRRRDPPNKGLQAPPGTDNSPQASMDRLYQLIKKNEEEKESRQS
ncbi:MAG: hypothetical protein Q9200_001643 [Gallowayella weberi]